MSIGYIDPITKKYIKKAGDMNVLNTPIASTTQAGLCSPEQAKKIDSAYSTEDIADRETILELFKKGE